MGFELYSLLDIKRLMCLNILRFKIYMIEITILSTDSVWHHALLGVWSFIVKQITSGK